MVGSTESGLAGLYRKGVSASQPLANSRNWLALGGTVSLESRPQMSKHQNKYILKYIEAGTFVIALKLTLLLFISLL